MADNDSSAIERGATVADTAVKNHFGEWFWLKKIPEGITECCLTSAPCLRHKKMEN